LGGYASLEGKISVNDKYEGVKKVSVLFHEIAHQLIHFDKDFSRKDSTREQRETDAELVSYVVCSHYHIENKDAPLYLAGWKANKDTIMGRLGYVQKAAIEMFEGIDQYMSALTGMKGNVEQTKTELTPQEMPKQDVSPLITSNFYGKLGLFKNS